jgi:hypothetical protein
VAKRAAAVWALALAQARARVQVPVAVQVQVPAQVPALGPEPARAIAESPPALRRLSRQNSLYLFCTCSC